MSLVGSAWPSHRRVQSLLQKGDIANDRPDLPRITLRTEKVDASVMRCLRTAVAGDDSHKSVFHNRACVADVPRALAGVACVAFRIFGQVSDPKGACMASCCILRCS